MAYNLSLVVSVKGFQAIGNTQYFNSWFIQDIQIQSDKVNTSKSQNRKGTYSFWGRHLAGKIFIFKITSPFSNNKTLKKLVG